MRDLKLLYKYASRSYKPKKERKLKLSGALMWILSLFIMASIALPMITVFYSLFKMLAIPVSTLGLSHHGYLVDIYMFVLPLTFGLMLILTLVPSIIFTLFEADDMNFLLSMPIKRWTLFFFKASMGLSAGIFPVIMLVIVSICYAVVLELNIFIAVFGILLFLIFIFLLSLALGSAMTRFINKSTARMMSQIFLYISLIIYVVIMNVFPRQAEDPQAIADSLGGIFNIIEGRYSWLLPTNWALFAIKGDPRVLAILGSLCLVLSVLAINLTKLTNLDSGRGKSRKKHRMELSRYPIVKKELRLLFRNPQNLFSISYAIIFPIIMTYVNRSTTSGAIFVSILATLYTATLSLQLIAEEKKIWPLPKLLPLGMSKLVQYKAVIPAAIFTMGYSAVLLISYLLIDMHPVMFISILPMAVVMIYSSTLGLSLFLDNPQRATTPNGVSLKFKEGLFLQLNTMILSLGIIIPFRMWAGIYSTNADLAILTELWWYRLIAYGMPWLIMIIGIVLIRRTFKKINTKIGAWE